MSLAPNQRRRHLSLAFPNQTSSILLPRQAKAMMNNLPRLGDWPSPKQYRLAAGPRCPANRTYLSPVQSLPHSSVISTVAARAARPPPRAGPTIAAAKGQFCGLNGQQGPSNDNRKPATPSNSFAKLVPNFP